VPSAMMAMRCGFPLLTMQCHLDPGLLHIFAEQSSSKLSEQMVLSAQHRAAASTLPHHCSC
jgi:hypothetical protein